MRNKTVYDPLTHLPDPSVVEKHLGETEELARRLRILLRVLLAMNEDISPLHGEQTEVPS